MNRQMRRTLLGGLVVVGAALALACGASGMVEQAAFQASCANECASQGADRALCESYCQCSYQYASSNQRLDELANVQVVPGQAMPPIVNDLMAECGSDLYDSNFRRECNRTCGADPSCATKCDCFLRELRGTGPRNESTRFLFTNLDVTPPTPAGQARLDAAEAVCTR